MQLISPNAGVTGTKTMYDLLVRAWVRKSPQPSVAMLPTSLQTTNYDLCTYIKIGPALYIFFIMEFTLELALLGA